jgi:hypothetical protein
MRDSESFGALLRVLDSSSRISRLLGELEKAEKNKASVSGVNMDIDSLPSPNPEALPPHSKILYGNVILTCRKCADCGAEEHARAFVQAPPLSVVLCSNRLER